jgi:signal transduction histidine kinase
MVRFNNIPLDRDPFLLYPTDMLEVLFEQMPTGMVVLDVAFRLLRFNTTWENYVRRCSPEAAHLLQSGYSLFDLLPSSRSALEPLFERVLLGETVCEQVLCAATEDPKAYVNLIAAPLRHGMTVAAILVVGMNITPQTMAQYELQQALQSLQRSHEEIEQRVNERTHELTTLITIQQALTSTLHFNEVLLMIVHEARRLTHTDVSAVFLPDDQGLSLAVLSSEQAIDLQPGYHISLTNSITGTAFRTGQTQLVMDVAHHAKTDANIIQKAGLNALLSMPLMSGTQSIGVLLVGNKVKGTLGKEQERLLKMMAPSAVIALENVRRYEHASEIAVAAERGRLARDLHDSVTQTLFSASLTAEVLPRLWDRSPSEGRKRLEKLRELTRGALAEMRTLLLELRPTALAEMGLRDLLQQLAEGIAGRTQIHIDVTIEGECTLLNEVKIALYRITQEALNNVARHSKAQNAQIRLIQSDEQIELSIMDDGCGFDATVNRANHLGLRIMAERVEAIGATLDLQTQNRGGTQIKVLWHREGTETDEN